MVMEWKMESKNLLTLLQLSDSAFPIGGFSHSLGLEACVQHYNGAKIDPQELYSIFVFILENAGSYAIPFVKTSHSADENLQLLSEMDNFCETCTPNHVANKASKKQGAGLMELACNVFEDLTESFKISLSDLPHCHFPIVFGAIMKRLGYSLDITEIAFMSSIVRTMISSAVRLDSVGPMEGQRIQVKLQKILPDILQRNKERTMDEICIKFPLIDILQNAQDTFFCKLFYS